MYDNIPSLEDWRRVFNNLIKGCNKLNKYIKKHFGEELPTYYLYEDGEFNFTQSQISEALDGYEKVVPGARATLEEAARFYMRERINQENRQKGRLRQLLKRVKF